MSDLTDEAFRRDVTLALGTIMDMIGGVITACHHDGNLDSARLRGVFEDLSSRPDVSLLERAMFERVLRSMP